MLDSLKSYGYSLSYAGLFFGTLFFAASLAPSLLPRDFILQGLLSGVAFTTGYGLGSLFAWLWRYLELKEPSERANKFLHPAMVVGASLVALIFLWRASIWQNSIRSLMEMEPVASAHPWRVGLIAVICSVLLISFGRVLMWGQKQVAKKLDQLLPRRVSIIISVFAVSLVVLSLTERVVIRNALRVADTAFAELDERVDEGISRPSIFSASGNPESLIDWDSIGRRGKNFIKNGPVQSQLRQFSGREAKQPLRVYVGVRTRETLEERARLALEELKRIKAFERSVLIVATPTGTGWLDPGAVDSLEYLHNGDTAIVAIQYSYLPSWMTLLVDPDRSRAAARALFKEVYGFWTTLPKDQRPRLYLHGLSLGALGSEASTQLFLILDDLVHGAVWSGPPFPSSLWSAAIRSRNPGSPEWLPQIADGAMIRFTGQRNSLTNPVRKWGPVRVVYIQYASDPMVFFSPGMLFRKPDWLRGSRGPDVSPYFDWYPVISFLQVGFDLPNATSVPRGYGHNYSASSYIDAWIEVTQPPGWSHDDIRRLKNIFAEKRSGQ
ncbi:MAG: alpha/beta-hydrolase family protein [Pseudomonadota bacterium]